MGGITKLFKAPEPPKIQMPKQKDPVVLPTVNSQQVQDERRRATQETSNSAGRASTILTGNPAPTYANDLLGQ